MAVKLHDANVSASIQVLGLECAARLEALMFDGFYDYRLSPAI